MSERFVNLPEKLSIKAIEEILGLTPGVIASWKSRKLISYNESDLRGENVALTREQIARIIVIQAVRNQVRKERGDGSDYANDVKMTFRYPDWVDDYSEMINEMGWNLFSPRVDQ